MPYGNQRRDHRASPRRRRTRSPQDLRDVLSGDLRQVLNKRQRRSPSPERRRSPPQHRHFSPSRRRSPNRRRSPTRRHSPEGRRSPLNSRHSPNDRHSPNRRFSPHRSSRGSRSRRPQNRQRSTSKPKSPVPHRRERSKKVHVTHSLDVDARNPPAFSTLDVRSPGRIIVDREDNREVFPPGISSVRYPSGRDIASPNENREVFPPGLISPARHSRNSEIPWEYRSLSPRLRPLSPQIELPLPVSSRGDDPADRRSRSPTEMIHRLRELASPNRELKERLRELASPDRPINADQRDWNEQDMDFRQALDQQERNRRQSPKNQMRRMPRSPIPFRRRGSRSPINFDRRIPEFHPMRSPGRMPSPGVNHMRTSPSLCRSPMGIDLSPSLFPERSPIRMASSPRRPPFGMNLTLGVSPPRRYSQSPSRTRSRSPARPRRLSPMLMSPVRSPDRLTIRFSQSPRRVSLHRNISPGRNVNRSPRRRRSLSPHTLNVSPPMRTSVSPPGRPPRSPDLRALLERKGISPGRKDEDSRRRQRLSEERQKRRSRPRQKKTIKCKVCELIGHAAKDCPNLVCYRCKEPGHFAKECPNNLMFQPKNAQLQSEEDKINNSKSENLTGMEISVSNSQDGSQVGSNTSGEKKIVCFFCKEPGHHYKLCPKRLEEIKQARKKAWEEAQAKKIICFNCKEPGHHFKECKKQSTLTCFNCHKVGHHLNDCTEELKLENIELHLVCKYCKVQGHHIRNCPNIPKKLPKLDLQPVCYNCQKIGHHVLQCTDMIAPNAEKHFQCNYCKEIGHYVRDCPKIIVKNSAGEPCTYCYASDHGSQECPFNTQQKSSSSDDPTVSTTVNMDQTCLNCGEKGHMICTKLKNDGEENEDKDEDENEQDDGEEGIQITDDGKEGSQSKTRPNCAVCDKKEPDHWSSSCPEFKKGDISCLKCGQKENHGPGCLVKQMKTRGKRGGKKKNKNVANTSSAGPIGTGLSQAKLGVTRYPCNLCNKYGHYVRDCSLFFCKTCGQHGHLDKGCPRKTSWVQPELFSRRGQNSPPRSTRQPHLSSNLIQRKSLLSFFCEKLIANGKPIYNGDSYMMTWKMAGHDDETLKELYFRLNPTTASQLRLALVKELSKVPAGRIPMSVNISELLDETVRYFMPDDGYLPKADPMPSMFPTRQRRLHENSYDNRPSGYDTLGWRTDEGHRGPSVDDGLVNIQSALQSVSSMKRFQSLDSVINRDASGEYDQRLKSLQGIKEFMAEKMSVMHDMFGISENYIDAVTNTIPKLMAHVGLSLYTLQQEHTSFGSKYLSETLTDKLQTYEPHFPSGVKLEYITSMILDYFNRLAEIE